MSSVSAPMWVLAAVAVALFLRQAHALFLPIALAALLAFALAPVVRLLERLRLPRLAAAAILLTLLGGLAVWGTYSLGDNIASGIQRLPQTAREIRERMEHGGGSVLQRMSRAADELRQVGTSETSREKSDGGAAPLDASAALWSGSAGALTFLGNLVVVTFLVFFFLATGSTYRGRVIDLLRPHVDGTREAAEILDEITAQVERFVIVRLATAALVGLATWIALRLMDAPQPGLWGTLAGVFNSIPFFGPVIVSGGLFAVGLLARGLTFGSELALVALVMTTVEGWLVTPPLLGRAARMHTLAVFIGLLVWSWMWGVWGTILAVPIMTTIKVIADHVPRLRALAVMLRE